MYEYYIDGGAKEATELFTGQKAKIFKLLIGLTVLLEIKIIIFV